MGDNVMLLDAGARVHQSMRFVGKWFVVRV
jgi:hypothetical protein